jgi:hypothetical protein
MGNFRYESAGVTVFGLVVFLLLLLAAKGANRLNIGPQWLRQFKIETHTLH